MFDLFRSSDKIKKYILGGLLTLVALSMVTYLIPNYNLGTTPADNPVLAEIGGQKITAQQAQQLFEKYSQGKIPPDLMEVYLPQFVEQMVSERAALYEANRLGITATDDEALSNIVANYPQFFPNGALANTDQFQAALAQQGITLQDVVNEARDQIILHKLQSAVLGSVVVTPKDIEDEYRKKYEKMKIQYIAFPPAKFRDQAKPTDEEVRSYYDKNKDKFTQPAKTAYQVAVLDQDKVAATINVTDEQLRSAYSSALDNFRMPERVHARHILLKTDGKSDAEKKALKAKAEDLLKQLKNGADFAELAKKYSDDGSKDQGGDLGWFVRNQMVPEFDSVAFSLKPKELSGVVTSQFGYHIIQVLEKDPARLKPFEEVKDELREGDQILVKVLAIEGNRIKLSRKAVLREQRAKLGLPDPAQVGADGPNARAAASAQNFNDAEEGEDFDEEDDEIDESEESGDSENEPNFNRSDSVPAPAGTGGGQGGQQQRKPGGRRRRGGRRGGPGGGPRGGGNNNQ